MIQNRLFSQYLHFMSGSCTLFHTGAEIMSMRVSLRLFWIFKSMLGKYAKTCMEQKGTIWYQPREVRLGKFAIHLFI